MADEENGNEKLDDANEELKRADHLIFVSLKYTRTCDMIKHIVDRLINCIDCCLTALLEAEKERGRITEIPSAPIPKANLAKMLYPDDEFIPRFAEFFIKLRKITKADFSRAAEFRRHVTMTVIIDEEEIKLDIDIITAFFKDTKEFFAHIKKIVEPSSE
jgi:hypothetical protein